MYPREKTAGPATKSRTEQLWDQWWWGCSPLLLLLLISFHLCVCVCCLFFVLLNTVNTETTMFGFLPMPHHPAEDGHLFSQPAEAEEGWNEHSEGHQNGKHEAAVVRGIGVRCAGA